MGSGFRLRGHGHPPVEEPSSSSEDSEDERGRAHAFSPGSGGHLVAPAAGGSAETGHEEADPKEVKVVDASQQRGGILSTAIMTAKERQQQQLFAPQESTPEKLKRKRKKKKASSIQLDAQQ